MYTDLLQSVGLSQNEAKIYEVLLLAGESGVGEIATKGKIHRRNVYDALQRLVEKGLVFPIFQKGENRYTAVGPDKLMELIKEKQTTLEHALPEMRKMYDAEAPQEAAYIYRGIEGYKNYLRDLVRIGGDVYFLGAKAIRYSPQISNVFLQNFLQMTKTKKMHFRTIFDPRVPIELPQALTDLKGEYKVLPSGYETPGVCDIFGDHVVTFTGTGVGTFGEDGAVYVMINKELADTYRTWFKFIWDHCE